MLQRSISSWEARGARAARSAEIVPLERSGSGRTARERQRRRGAHRQAGAALAPEFPILPLLPHALGGAQAARRAAGCRFSHTRRARVCGRGARRPHCAPTAVRGRAEVSRALRRVALLQPTKLESQRTHSYLLRSR